MKRFATVFNDINSIANFIPFLSWSHFCEIMRIKDEQARLYYAKDAAERQLGIRELRQQIARKPFERQEIANMQLAENSKVPFNVFKDPYLLDTLGLKDNFLEADLENAILLELDKAGIVVAEYWTSLPPKNLLEKKINEIFVETKERLKRRRLLPNASDRKIDYFLEDEEYIDE